jgi:maltose alpha-D-glucosyltransferase / alpha-amylase
MNQEEPQSFKQELEAALPAFLHTCRWYGDKSGEIAAVEWFDLGSIALDGAQLKNGIISVALGTGERSWYALPVVVDPHHSELTPITQVQSESGVAFIYDAIEHPLFAQWLVTLLTDPDHAESQQVGAAWRPTRALDQIGHWPSAAQARVSRAEQSNSSIVFGDRIMVKIFRKLRAGTNPDVEMGRYLTEETSFDSMPAVLGELQVSLPNDGQASFGVAQRFIESDADGWQHALDYLKSIVSASSTSELGHQAWISSMRILGETTAELHLELARTSANRDFNPEPVVQTDVLAWEREVEDSLAKVESRLRRLSALENEDASLVAAFFEAVPRLEARAARFDRLIGTSKIRIHGDFHLGQTLRTPDGKFIFLDFEGEPLRPIAERRAKSSPLRDVAGMFRSFNYARGVTERSNPANEDSASLLVGWERETRDSFLGGYFDRSGRARFLPDSTEDMREALAAWELHKALYEILYELDNRPSWMALPLSATLKLA